MSMPPRSGANLGPIVVRVVREAIAAMPNGDGPRIRTAVVRATRGMPGRERQDLIIRMAGLAADLANRLPVEQREEALAVCGMTDTELGEVLFRKIVSVSGGGNV
jgi:ribosomal protein L14